MLGSVEVTPVMLPPGRPETLDHPDLTGSGTAMNTIGSASTRLAGSR